MAGETVRAEAVCLGIHPWSKTSHIVSWLTPAGRVATVVKGAVRPKSAFLGQYDLNYTCEIVYYARERGDLHVLREAAPLVRRDGLRESYRALVLAEYFRLLAAELAPSGPEARGWFELLADSLDRLADTRTGTVAGLLEYELAALDLAGLAPDFAAEKGRLTLRGERAIPVSDAVARCCRDPAGEKNLQILLDAARVIGVFYSLHLDCAPEVRRTVLGLISKQGQQGKEPK